MDCFKIIIEENNIADNAKPIGKDGKLISITKMAINVHLFGIGAGSSL